MIATIVLAALGVLILVRNEIAFYVKRVILKTDGIPAHDALPSYSAMVVHPNYWLKWSIADWREYLSRRTA